jgi:hypothetical protein
LRPFDSAAAVELGVRTAKAIAAGDKRESAPADTPWTKVKFDRQIVVIAIVNGASEIISDDPHVKALGERWGMKVTSVDDLPVPKELIPPPLLAALEDEANEDNPEPGTPIVRRSGAGHPEDQADAEGSQTEAQGAPHDSPEEIEKLDLSKELESETPASEKPAGDAKNGR